MLGGSLHLDRDSHMLVVTQLRLVSKQLMVMIYYKVYFRFFSCVGIKTNLMTIQTNPKVENHN